MYVRKGGQNPVKHPVLDHVLGLDHPVIVHVLKNFK